MTDLDLAALYRLARAASDLGHYNLSKLLNVAAVSYVNRAAWTGSPLTTDRALAEAVAALEPQLRAAQLDQHLLGALQRARETVAAGQLVSYEEAPIIYVCRVCGAVAQTTPPEQCPYCGAGQLVFQLIPATFYLESAPVPIVMAQLARTPNWLEAIFSGLTEDQAARRVDGHEGEWSLHEAAGHLLDTQELIALRVHCFLEHESPNLNAKAHVAIDRIGAMVGRGYCVEVPLVARSHVDPTSLGARRLLEPKRPARGIWPGDIAAAVHLFCQA